MISLSKSDYVFQTQELYKGLANRERTVRYYQDRYGFSGLVMVFPLSLAGSGEDRVLPLGNTSMTSTSSLLYTGNAKPHSGPVQINRC